MTFTPSPEAFGQKVSSEATPQSKPVAAPTAKVKAQVTPTDFIPEVTLPATKLPSRGIPYPAGSTVTYKPYTYGEVKYVSQSKLNEKQMLEFSLKGVECSFDVMHLTVPDVLYIGFLRKLSTMGGVKFTTGYQCGNDQCGSKEREVVDSSMIEFEDLRTPELPMIVDFSFGQVQFNPATIEQFYALCDMKKQTDEIAFLAVQSDLPFEQAYNRFFNVLHEDGITLAEVDRLLYHGIKPIIMTCSKCKTKNSVELDGGQALILPFRGDKESVQTRIHFGHAPAHKPS